MLLLKGIPSSDPRLDALILILALAFYALLLVGLVCVKGA